LFYELSLLLDVYMQEAETKAKQLNEQKEKERLQNAKVPAL